MYATTKDRSTRDNEIGDKNDRHLPIVGNEQADLTIRRPV